MSKMIHYEHIPTEILGLIESYLPPSDCAHLSATSTSLHCRWTARRWQRTFQLHYGRRSQIRAKERRLKLKKARKRLMRPSRNLDFDQEVLHSAEFSDKCNNEMDEENCMLYFNCIAKKVDAAFAKYSECYEDGWEFTFVGCCHDQYDFCAQCKHLARPCTGSSSFGNNCISNRAILSAGTTMSSTGQGVATEGTFQTQNNSRRVGFGGYESYDDMCALTTRFNVTALVPSVQRLYVDLWDTIELSLLGYYDADETETAGERYIHHPTHHSQFPVPAIMRILRTSVLPELTEYLSFVIGFEPLAVRVMNSRWGGGATARRRDAGVMGPMLSRGLGGVRLRLDSQPQRQQVGIGSSLSTLTVNNDRENDSNVRSANAKRGIAVSQEINVMEPPHLHANSTTMLDEINSLRDAASSMSAWKLASILRDRGVGCLRCAICDRIDLLDDFDEDHCGTTDDGTQLDGGTDEDSDEELHGESMRSSSRNNHHGTSGRSPFLREFQKQIGGGEAWMTPCQCPELVHRKCLERKLKLVPKYEPWEHMKLHLGRVYALTCTFFSRNEDSVRDAHYLQKSQSSEPNRSFLVPSPLTAETSSVNEPLAPRVWISYDNIGGRDAEEEDDVIAVNRMGQFRSSAATCETCGWQYLRTVRLPRSKWEVVAASLSDPISMMRAASTLIHFVLACAFLAACEGMCSDVSCDSSHRTLMNTKFGALKWPTTGLNGFALAWWQLQQCCMLHIFFSPRFVAIVDRLWVGPISLFYCRLYFYFIITSALLATSYIPMASRTIRIKVLEPLVSPWILKALQPVGEAVALANLVQYAVVSSSVICIFWRTNYRIFTVADGKEAAATLRRREETNNAQGDGGLGRDAMQNINADQDVAAHADHIAINAIPMQRIVGVGAGETNAANHPMYHGPW